MDKKVVKQNLSTAFLGQSISLATGFVMSLIIPKLIDIQNYSYWQLFLFYIVYVGFFHFGINDGVYLKYGGLTFKEMNRDYVSGQFQYLALIQVVVAALALCVVFNLPLNSDRRIVWIFTCGYMIIFNLTNYLGYIFQAANKTRYFSYGLMIDRGCFLIILGILCISGIKYFVWFISGYMIAKIIALCYSMYRGRYFTAWIPRNYLSVLKELGNTISVGIKLTLAAVASMLILGIGRFFIDAHWNIEIFGKVSFAMALTYFVLSFIQQISMVFFPVLRRTGDVGQKKIYNLLYLFCFFVVPLVYILGFPGRWIVGLWLPAYEQSIFFWMILLPISIFDAKMNLVFNTFFKVHRGEKELFLINGSILACSVALSVIGVYLFNSYMWIIYSMVGVIFLRSLISELVLKKYIKVDRYKNLAWEAALGVLYIMTVTCINNQWLAFSAVLTLYLTQMIIFRKDLALFLQTLRSALHKN